MLGCDACALRLYNARGHHLKGVGNVQYGNMIIVHTVDKYAYKRQDFNFEKIIEELNRISISSTGEDVLSYCYITPLIKCKLNSVMFDDADVINLCKKYLKKEFIDYKPTKILLLGGAVMNQFLDYNVSPNKIYVDAHNRIWFNNYSPSIKLYNSDKALVFEQEFSKWCESVKYNNFECYER